MEGQNGYVPVVNKGGVGHGPPHVNDAFDSEIALDVVARSVDVAKFRAQETVVGVFGPGFVRHKGKIEYGDGSCAGTSHKEHGGVDSVFFLVRYKETHCGVGVLYGTVARSSNAGLGWKEAYPVIDGGGHVTHRGQMLAPLGDRFVIFRTKIESTAVNEHDQGSFI